MGEKHHRPSGRPWFEIKAATMTRNGSTAEIHIYDEIGDSWWGESTSAKDFIAGLKDIGDVANIDLHLNSPGGSVFDGIAIYNALVQHQARVTTYVDGYAASIASIIALAGDEVVMAENAMMMIHNPWSIVIGDSQEMRKVADSLDKIREAMVTTYMRHTSKSEEELLAALDDETWLTAADAQEWGFADTVSEPARAAALMRFDFAALGFNPPAALLARTQGSEIKATGRALTSSDERKLRDARDAIDAVLDGLADDEEDEDEDPDASVAGASPQSGDTGRRMEQERMAALVARTRW